MRMRAALLLCFMSKNTGGAGLGRTVGIFFFSIYVPILRSFYFIPSLDVVSRQVLACAGLVG